MKSKLIDEFKQFAMRGNVIDLAVGVVIGAAFGKIVSSLVADVIMPPIGVLVGGVNFTDLGITLKQAQTAGIFFRRLSTSSSSLLQSSCSSN